MGSSQNLQNGGSSLQLQLRSIQKMKTISVGSKFARFQNHFVVIVSGDSSERTKDAVDCGANGNKIEIM